MEFGSLSQYDQMIKYTTALRLGTAETEAILRRFTKQNLQHPTYKAFAELGKAIKTILRQMEDFRLGKSFMQHVKFGKAISATEELLRMRASFSKFISSREVGVTRRCYSVQGTFNFDFGGKNGAGNVGCGLSVCFIRAPGFRLNCGCATRAYLSVSQNRFWQSIACSLRPNSVTGSSPKCLKKSS